MKTLYLIAVVLSFASLINGAGRNKRDTCTYFATICKYDNIPTFIDRKILTFFQIIDSNHDGEISAVDYQAIANSHIAIGKLDALRARQVNRKWMQSVWDAIFAADAKKSRLTVDLFGQACKNFGAVRMKRLCAEMFASVFDAVDVRGDGTIRKEEFALAQRVFTFNDTNLDDTFAKLDVDKDGYLTAFEYSTYGIDYFSSDNELDVHRYFFGPLL